MTTIDLTPFGFTPTESLAYGALLDIGPSSGYAVAKELGVARANAYQALNGLVGKGAAVSVEEQPTRYRAERPDALLARVIDRESSKLDALEKQVRAVGPQNGQVTISLMGRRTLTDLALRTVARAEGHLVCIGPADLVAEIGPAWRRRMAEDRPTAVWLMGANPGNLPIAPTGHIDEATALELFGSPIFALITADVAVLARVDGDNAEGYWTSDKTIFGSVRATVQSLTG